MGFRSKAMWCGAVMRKVGFVQYQEYKILKGYLTFVLGKIGEPERLSLFLSFCVCVCMSGTLHIILRNTAHLL